MAIPRPIRVLALACLVLLLFLLFLVLKGQPRDIGSLPLRGDPFQKEHPKEPLRNDINQKWHDPNLDRMIGSFLLSDTVAFLLMRVSN